MKEQAVKQLVQYAVDRGLIEEYDRICAQNKLLEILKTDSVSDEPFETCTDLETILETLCDEAAKDGLLENNSVVYRDLFDTKLMGALTPFPSTVIKKFYSLYEESPEKATDYYYALSKATNYIRDYRVKKDMKWKTESEYGEIDITVNLSKPEKDPKAIAAAKALPQSGYPKCLLCRENEGYAGRVNSPARQNHRIIPISLSGDEWYLQYSPYVYYNEHCIAFSKEHVPMKIDDGTFRKLLDFVGVFPHYFIGSNADLPIVGGSILTHNHMQGGHYTFAMERAGAEIPLVFDGYDGVDASIVHWPMAVLRITGDDKEKLCALAGEILSKWRAYTDEDAFIFAETNGEPHNTITPIARRRGEKYELDLVLRNNITTEEHPLGVYHPHAELHNIKKENIGLIEVMGLAVLPARLKAEIAAMKEAILSGTDFSTLPEIEKHAAWFTSFRDKYTFTPENTEDILKDEIGKTFVRVLEDAGVYKCTSEGRNAFLRFVSVCGGHKK